MNSTTKTDSANALRLATELHAVSLTHGERNWIRGVHEIVALLQGGDLAVAAHSYKAMLAGNGSFSDFYIHADDLAARRRLNEPLDRLRDQLWIALGL